MSSTVHSKTRAIDSAVSHYRHPVLFYALATAIPWALWLTAGALSRQAATPASEIAVATLGLVGLAAPVGVAAAMVARDPWLRRDTLHRLVNVRDAPAWVWILTVVLMPGALLVATTLSIGLGYPTEQFLLRGGASFTTGLVPAVVTLTLAPLLEDLAWHSYGTDALASRWSVWKTSIVFAFLWAIWHIPLAPIEGNYQSEVVENGALATFTFLGSVFPFVILMNWLYYRGGATSGWPWCSTSSTACATSERATPAGTGPTPGMSAGSGSPCSSAASVITRWTPTATSAADACPVSRSTRVLSITCPRDRGSPAARAVSAAEPSAARQATPWASGSSAVRYVIEPGAGRSDTPRSPTARSYTADEQVEALFAEGWNAGDIALITLGARHPVQSERQESLGQRGYWDLYWDGDHIFYGRVLGFKGMERRAVVLCVNEDGTRDRASERLYVSLSRATDRLIVVGDPDAITRMGGAEVRRRLGIAP